MPNRIIRDSCKTSPSLDLLSDGAERFFWRLVTVADDFGRFEADPRILLAKTFPLRVDRMRPKQAEGWFNELRSNGIVNLYSHGGRVYGHFLNWTKHQDTRAKASKFPDPQASASICSQVLADVPVTESESVSENRNREPRTDTLDQPSADRVEVDDGFTAFWKAYPKRIGKGAALKAWRKIRPANGTQEAILKAVEAQKVWPAWTKDDGQYIPHPATWLNQSRWEDEGDSGQTFDLDRFRRIPR